MEQLLTLDFSTLNWYNKLVFCLAVIRGQQIQVEDPSPDAFDEEYERHMGDLH